MENKKVCLGRNLMVTECHHDLFLVVRVAQLFLVGKSRNAPKECVTSGQTSREEDYVQSKDISRAWLNVYDSLFKRISKNPTFMTHRPHNLLLQEKSSDLKDFKNLI